MKAILFFLFSSFVVFTANAQSKILKGTITTFDSIAVCGAEIKVKSSKTTVLSDSLGNFTVECNNEDKIKVLAKGFYSQNVDIEENVKFAAVNLKLKSGDKNLEYALGYGRVEDRDKLSALAKISNSDFDFSQYRDMHELISGRLPNVQIINGDIIIRGNASISGPTPALIVVDGTPVPQASFNAMSPSNVKSINVIKDGTSAIYGARGANGVIVVETKKGGE